MINNVAPHPGLVVGALIAVQILFGLNYVISKVVVASFPPLIWASIRIVISAAIMFSVASLSRREKPSVDGKKFFIPLIIFALLGTVINQACFLLGLSYTTSTNSAILNTLIPVFTLLVVTITGQEPATPRRIFGFICALAGVLAIRKVENFTFSDETFIGDLLTMTNCFSYALFLSFSRDFLQRYDRIWTTAWLFLYGSVGLTALSIPSWMTFQMPELTPLLIGCAVFAIIGGTLLTYFLNNWALVYARSSQVALFIYIQPVIAALLAWAWFDEVITMRTALSSILIFVGVFFALNRDQPPPRDAEGIQA